MRPVTEVTGTLEGAAPGIQVNNSYGERVVTNLKFVFVDLVLLMGQMLR